MSPPRLCRFCAAKPVVKKTVGYCYDCHPAGRVVPPPCQRCGSLGHYYSAGLRDRCHQYAPQPITSCLDCYGWGVTRIHGWLCRGCTGWRLHNPTVANCAVCRDRRHVGRGGYCRLCWRTASTWHTANRRINSTYIPLDVAGGNRDGQQLFLVDLMGPRTRSRRKVRADQLIVTPTDAPATTNRSRPERVPFRQRALFDNNPPSWLDRHGVPAPRSPRLTAALQTLARDIGEARGWSRTSRGRVTIGLNTLLGWQTTPGEPILGSDLDRMAELGLQCANLVEVVLTEAGLFIEARTPAVDEWFTRTIAGLPAPMTDELTIWFTVLRHGSTTPPRYRPRHETTVRIRVRYAPALHTCVTDGHTTLRDITAADVTAVLPAAGNPRALIAASLRSMFLVLKGRRVIFTNPIARIATGAPERREPLPVDLDALRDVLHGDAPAAAAMAALLAFHGIRAGQLRQLQLIDIRDGRLHVDGRIIPLAQPVRDRIAGWLDDRAARWPRSANPHLFIHQRTAPHTDPVGTRYLALRMRMRATSIRDDGILYEAHATAGDVRRLVDLFGSTVKTAARYTRTVDHPSFEQ